jgi:hypothetical protein
MAEPCKHKQCSICLRRTCRDGVGHLEDYGSLLACRSCVAKSVAFAYDVACKWGGDYGPDFCDYEARRKKEAAAKVKT